MIFKFFIFRLEGFGVKNSGQCGGKERGMLDERLRQILFSYDYFVFDKVSRQKVLAQYNLLVASELIEKDYIKKVFENEVTAILKNEKIGEDCIEPRSIN